MQGRNKLLANIDGTPMIRRVVQAAVASKVDEVIVVLGWEEEKIRNALAGLNCRMAVNRNFMKGQSTSVRAGLAEVNQSSRAVLILPGDVARIDSGSINTVIDKYNQDGSPIVIAGHQGRSGHPILLDERLFTEIALINEETFGLKAVVVKHQNETCLVETGSSKVLKDVDTPEDLEKLAKPD